MQPFLIRTSIEKRARKHVPDYLLLTDAGPVVVDVKPRSQFDKPKVKFTLDWPVTGWGPVGNAAFRETNVGAAPVRHDVSAQFRAVCRCSQT